MPTADNYVRQGVTTLMEGLDGSSPLPIKLFLDRVAATRVGVTDYRNLVEEKLRTAGELYEFMTNEFHQARGFVLELMVVAILVIELVKLFWGGHL